MSHGRSRTRSGTLLALVAMPLLAICPGARSQSTSASYVLHTSTADDAGDVSLSSGYRLTASLGQEATIGASSSHRFVLQSGFWSFVGSGLVPVVLTVDKNATHYGNVDLSWSGNNAPYDVYQHVDCADVFAGFLATRTTNDYPDVTPPAATLLCYSVLATAPGPAPPP